MRILLAGLAALFSSLAAAQGFPERPVRIIVPLPPGGSPDTIARTIGQGLQGVWPHPVVVGGKLYLREQDALYVYELRG